MREDPDLDCTLLACGKWSWSDQLLMLDSIFAKPCIFYCLRCRTGSFAIVS